MATPVAKQVTNPVPKHAFTNSSNINPTATNSVKRQQVQHKRKHVGNKSKKKVKKNDCSKTNTILKCQTCKEIRNKKLLHILESLPIPSCYKTKHLLDNTTHLDWMQDVEIVL